MKTGLVLGKFAPLHKGHQLLIETALAENQRVILMIYDAADVTSVPLSVRAQWLRDLYPAAEVRLAWDGPQEVGDTPRIRQLHDDYLRAFLAGERIDAFYSSEFYGEHVSRALGAQDRRIDPPRQRFPVSGTAIRADSFANRHFLEPRVYRDLITRVVFLGAPSTGKTTLAQALAAQHGTCWMPEYGREYWQQHQQQRRLSEAQLLQIAQGHLAREEACLLEARTVLFVDTDASTTAMFSRDYHGQVSAPLQQLAEEAARRYDLHFLCDTDIPYDDTQDRSGDAHRQRFQQQIRADLLVRKVPFITLQGSLARRMERVNQVLTGFDRHSGLGDQFLASQVR